MRQKTNKANTETLDLLKDGLTMLLITHIKNFLFNQNKLDRSYYILGIALMGWLSVYYGLNSYLDGSLDLVNKVFLDAIYTIVDFMIIAFTCTTFYYAYNKNKSLLKLGVYIVSLVIFGYMSFYTYVDLSFDGPLHFMSGSFWRVLFALINPILFAYIGTCLWLKFKKRL